MTDTVQLALIASIAPTLAACGALLVSILNRQKATETGHKVDTVIEKAVEIHTLTNSNLSKVTAANDVLTAKVEGLQKLVASMVDAKTVADSVAEKKAAKE